MNIIEACRDPQMFKPYLGQGWHGGPWDTALRCLYGLPVNGPRGQALVAQATGRQADSMPTRGFNTALFLTGRRSGKSRIAGLIGGFEAVLAQHKPLAPGEQGLVAVCAPTLDQATIVKAYLRAVFDVPLLASMVRREDRTGFDLANGNRIQILAGDWRTVRGYTLLAAIVDEACFFGYDSESKVKNDTELIRAIKPALATTGGRCILISSPYAKRGYCYKQWERCWGNPDAATLVWRVASTTMNPTLPQHVIDEAMAEDMAAARAEYLAEWRDDVGEFLPREVITRLVVPGCLELQPDTRHHRYAAFVDMSGGRADDAALAIAHAEGRKVITDYLGRWRPPFNPQQVVAEMANALREYGCRHATGDNYAAEWVAQAFKANGIGYTKCEKPKSKLYAELLPRLCSGEIALLDDEALVNQLASLERRVRAGGNDIIDHPPGGHDDLANAVAGVATVAHQHRLRAGALR